MIACYQGVCRQRGNVGGCWLGGTGRLRGGRSLGAKMASLLMPRRHISVRLVLYSQGCRVTAYLWGAERMRKARPQHKGQPVVPMGEVERKGKGLKRKWCLKILSTKQNVESGPNSDLAVDMSSTHLCGSEKNQFLKLLL